MANYTDKKGVNNNWIGTNRADDMRGGAGNDRIDGGAGNDYILGGTGDDILLGGAGDDRIWAQKGTDTITGGTGADYFIFNDAYDSRAGDGIDTILDFKPTEGDQIDLRGLGTKDANQTVLPIAFVAAPTGTANEFTLTFDANLNRTALEFYRLDGDMLVDNTIYLSGHITGADGILLV
jgi:Ca2+-binding RTX toxin-like protein